MIALTAATGQLGSLVVEIPNDTSAARIAEIVCAISHRQRAC